MMHRLRDWIRSRYGLRELILPEKYRVEEEHEVVVTYSSCLALLYFIDDPAPLGLDDILNDPRRGELYTRLLRHPGVGLLATRHRGAYPVEDVGLFERHCNIVRRGVGAGDLQDAGIQVHADRFADALSAVWKKPGIDKASVIFVSWDGHPPHMLKLMERSAGETTIGEFLEFESEATRLGTD